MTATVPGWSEDLWEGFSDGAGVPEVESNEPVTPTEADKRSNELISNLSEDFWAARERFQRIRIAAWRNGGSGDVAMLTVLCRTAAMCSHQLTFDLGRGEGSLNLFGGAVGGTGTGKSVSVEAGQGIIIAPAYLCDPNGDVDPDKFKDGIPIGSGEGLAEAYMGMREVETGDIHKSGPKRGDPKTEKIRAQVRHNVFFYCDEGEMLTRTGNDRKGTTIWQTIRTAWIGGPLGQQNARDETTRLVNRRKYSLGMVIGYQPETAQDLLADGGPGTPQRFAWASSIDPKLPLSRPDAPHPFFLPLAQRDGRPVAGVIGGPQWIADMLWAQRVGVVHGERRIETLDSHRDLMLCKLSALFAIIEGRMEVVDEDWQLAEVFWANSCAIRDRMIEFGRREAKIRQEQSTAAHVDREERVHVARLSADSHIDRVARWIGKRVHLRNDTGRDSETRSALKHGLSSEDRKYFEPSFKAAVDAGFVILDDRIVRPGTARPA